MFAITLDKVVQCQATGSQVYVGKCGSFCFEAHVDEYLEHINQCNFGVVFYQGVPEKIKWDTPFSLFEKHNDEKTEAIRKFIFEDMRKNGWDF